MLSDLVVMVDLQCSEEGLLQHHTLEERVLPAILAVAVPEQVQETHLVRLLLVAVEPVAVVKQ